MSQSKRCSKCGLFKRATDFYRNINRDDGLRSACIECSRTEYDAEHESLKRRGHFERRTDLTDLGNRVHGKYDVSARGTCPRCSALMLHNEDADFKCVMCGHIEYVKAPEEPLGPGSALYRLTFTMASG